MVDITVEDPFCPTEMKDIVNPLKIHGDPFQTIGKFAGDRIKWHPASGLKVGKLRDFHAVQPHLPPKS